jgi:hypothetical protein
MTLTPRDKRMLQILAVVAGLALAFFLVTNVFGGGEEAALPSGPTGPGILPSASPSASGSPSPAETLPPVILAGARDPFSIPPGLATTTSAAPTSPTSPTSPGTTTSSTTTTTTSSTTTTTTTTSTSTTTTGPGGGDGNGNIATNEITIGGHRVRLRTISSGHARVEVMVDRRLWTVEEGATFDENFKLVKIQGRCARFLFGDQSFTLCLK